MAKAFVRALLDEMPSDHARMVCIRVMANYAGQTVYLPAVKKQERRQRQAAHMLANGSSAADVVNSLRERFGVTARTAWSDVNIARKTS